MTRGSPCHHPLDGNCVRATGPHTGGSPVPSPPGKELNFSGVLAPYHPLWCYQIQWRQPERKPMSYIVRTGNLAGTPELREG